jgi:hypothetical protein
MKIIILIMSLLFFPIGFASADSLNVVTPVGIPGADYSCSLYVSTWTQEVRVWVASLSPIGNISTDAKEVLTFDNSTYLSLDCRSDSAGNCGFYFVSKDGELASAEVMNCRPKIDKGSVEMISLMIGGLFGMAFVLAAVWRF